MKRTMDAEGVGSACVSLHDGSRVGAAGGEDGKGEDAARNWAVAFTSSWTSRMRP